MGIPDPARFAQRWLNAFNGLVVAGHGTYCPVQRLVPLATFRGWFIPWVMTGRV
jgi:hypothetical protein